MPGTYGGVLGGGLRAQSRCRCSVVALPYGAFASSGADMLCLQEIYEPEQVEILVARRAEAGYTYHTRGGDPRLRRLLSDLLA